MLPLFIIAPGLTAHAIRGFSATWRRQFDSRAPRFRQADGNRLLRRPRAMFAFADVMKFLAHKFASLGGRRFALPRIGPRPFDGSVFWHKI
jgi:hypothetical protein